LNRLILRKENEIFVILTFLSSSNKPKAPTNRYSEITGFWLKVTIASFFYILPDI